MCREPETRYTDFKKSPPGYHYADAADTRDNTAGGLLRIERAYRTLSNTASDEALPPAAQFKQHFTDKSASSRDSNSSGGGSGGGM